MARSLLALLMVLGCTVECAFCQSGINISLDQSFEDHQNSLFTLALSPDGKRLASGGVDKKIILWDVESMTPVATNDEGKGKILHLRFSADGKHVLATSEPKTIRILSTESLKEIKKLELPFRPIRIAVSPKSQTMAVSGKGDRAQLIEFPSGKVIRKLSGQSKNNQAICFSSDGSTVFIAGETAEGRGKLVAQSVRRRTQTIPLCELKGRPNRVKVNDDGELYLVAKNEACIVDAKDGRRLQTWTSSREADFLTITYWRQHQLYVTSDRDGYLNFWQKGKQQPIGKFRVSKTTAHDVLPISGERLITATQQAKRSLKTWKVEVSRELNTKPAKSTPKAQPVVVGKQEYEVAKPLNLISVSDERIQIIGSDEHAEQVGVAFESGRVTTFDMRKEKKLADVEVGNARLLEITYVPARDSIYLRTATHLVWLTTSKGVVRKSYRAELGYTNGRSSLARNSRNLAIPANGGLELVSTSFRGSARLLAPSPRKRADHGFTAAAFSRTKDILAGARRDGTVFFWKGDPLIGEPGKTPAYRPEATLKHPKETLVGLQFNDDKFATMSSSGILRLFSLEGKLQKEHSFGELVHAAFVPRQKQIALVTKKEPSLLQIVSFAEDQLKPVTSFPLNAGIPNAPELSLASMQFRRDGKRLVMGLVAADPKIQQSFIGVYRTEK